MSGPFAHLVRATPADLAEDCSRHGDGGQHCWESTWRTGVWPREPFFRLCRNCAFVQIRQTDGTEVIMRPVSITPPAP